MTVPSPDIQIETESLDRVQAALGASTQPVVLCDLGVRGKAPDIASFYDPGGEVGLAAAAGRADGGGRLDPQSLVLLTRPLPPEW